MWANPTVTYVVFPKSMYTPLITIANNKVHIGAWHHMIVLYFDIYLASSTPISDTNFND